MQTMVEEEDFLILTGGGFLYPIHDKEGRYSNPDEFKISSFNGSFDIKFLRSD